MKTWISVALLAVVCFFQKGDAQITGWSALSITGASGTATSPIIIPESQAVGATTNSIPASPTSPDTIASYTVSPSGTFSVTTAGVLTLDSALDFETTPTYTLTIVAVDNNVSPNSGTATVTVSVTNVNEAPTFTAATSTTCVADGATSGTTVTTVTASDQDSGDVITYTISAGDSGNVFTTPLPGGVLTTASTVPASPTQYVLTIHATDDDATPMIGTSTVTVNVQSASECSSATALAVSALTMMIALVMSLN